MTEIPTSNSRQLPSRSKPEQRRMLQGWANPARFMRLSGRLLPWLVGTTILSLVVGLVLAFRAPPDYQQGESVRIMFVHVPSAWMAMQIYVLLAAASAVSLIWRHPLADIAAAAAAPLGAGFTFLCLVTGSLWGKPMWGAWWVWDARLTSVLVLFFLYLGYLALLSAFDEPGRGARPAAILALVGAVNVPIIKFSVDWWNTLHQPASVLRSGGPTIDISMLLPLLVMSLAFTLFFATLLLVRMRTLLIERKIRAVEATRSAPAAGDGIAWAAAMQRPLGG